MVRGSRYSVSIQRLIFSPLKPHVRLRGSGLCALLSRIGPSFFLQGRILFPLQARDEQVYQRPPLSRQDLFRAQPAQRLFRRGTLSALPPVLDRKSTRLNSSHGYISYAV